MNLIPVLVYVQPKHRKGHWKKVYKRAVDIERLKKRGVKVKILGEEQFIYQKPKLSQQEIQSRLQPYEKLVHWIAQHYHKRFFRRFDIQDLSQTAMLGAVEAIVRNPKATGEELKTQIKRYALKRIKEFISDNLESIGAIKILDENLEKGYTLTSVIALETPQYDSEKTTLADKITEGLWTSVSEEENFKERAIFYEVMKRYLSPLELVCFQRVKLEREPSLRTIAAEVGVSYVAVKLAADRAEKKVKKALKTIMHLKTHSVSDVDLTKLKAEYSQLQLTKLTLNQYIALSLVARGKPIPDVNVVSMEDEALHFVYSGTDLWGIYDSVEKKYTLIK